MRIGPMIPTDFSILKEKLDAAKLEYAVNFDQEVKDNPALIKPADNVTNVPTFSGVKPYIYMELGSEALFLLKTDLEKMGFDVVHRDRSVADKPEYLCTQCDHVSEWPGECPQHGTKLLDFVTWSEVGRAKSKKRERIAMRILLVLVVVILAYVVLSR